MKKKYISWVLAATLTVTNALAYTAHYTKKDARIVIFDNLYAGWDFAWGLLGGLIFLAFIILLLYAWVKRKMQGK